MKNILKDTFLLVGGAAIGAAVTVLFTTAEGKEIRQKLRTAITEGMDTYCHTPKNNEKTETEVHDGE